MQRFTLFKNINPLAYTFTASVTVEISETDRTRLMMRAQCVPSLPACLFTPYAKTWLVICSQLYNIYSVLGQESMLVSYFNCVFKNHDRTEMIPRYVVKSIVRFMTISGPSGVVGKQRTRTCWQCTEPSCNTFTHDHVWVFVGR